MLRTARRPRAGGFYVGHRKYVRVYHLTSEQWGLESIRRRRLKLALLEDMNDPFELLGVELNTPEDREFFQYQLKPEMNRTVGLLCFSRKWGNSVLWSHYADKHRGLCLGFDIPDHLAKNVTYVGSRLKAELENAASLTDNDSFGFRLITTKYRHWRYEDEVRLIINLAHIQPAGPIQKDGQRYFVPYCNVLALREIVIGPRSKLTKQDLMLALAPEDKGVSVIAGRLAFRSYRVVRNRAK